LWASSERVRHRENLTQTGTVMTEEPQRESGASTLRDDLLRGYADGRFVETVYACSLAARDERDVVALEVAALQNEGLVDVVGEFENLKSKSANGGRFFSMRRVFEKALPHINANLPAVMRCVLRLYRDAGNDMAAGMIFDSYIGFCTKNASRPRDALAAIKANPVEFADLLTASLVAGSLIDRPMYLAEAMRLCGHDNIELRRRAVFAIGRIDWPTGEMASDAAFEALEASAECETDDHILGSVVKSAFALSQKDKTRELRTVPLIALALSKGAEVSLHAASELFGFFTKELSPALLDTLLEALKRVKPGNKGTLDNIDPGIEHLLKSQEPERGIAFLEELMLTHAGALSLGVFDSVLHHVAQTPPLFGRLATRWFLKGDRVLCDGLVEVSHKLYGANVALPVDPTELVPKDRVHLIFLARKIVGYFVTSPLLAASLIVSLMRETDDKGVLEALKQTLLDPLLLNYPSLAESYLANEARKGTGAVEVALDEAIKSLDAYFATLHSVGVIRELHPSEEQREAHMRQFGRQVADSFREAEKKSVFYGLVSKSVLLYGRKSVHRVYGPGGESRRMETALGNYSAKFDLPRMDNIDPVSLDYMIRMYRAERFRSK